LLFIKKFIVLLATTVLLLSLSLTAVATPYPVISEVSPASGFNNQQIAITISGAKFYSPKTTVKLVKNGQSDIVATDVVVSKNSITANLDLQGQMAGSWDVQVTNFGKITKKVRPTVLAGAFTILPVAPTIKTITPTNAFNDDTVTLTISGSDFRPGAVVSMVNANQVIPVVNLELNDDGKQIEAEFDLVDATPERYDIEVKNSDGTTAVLKQAFTVAAAPVAVITEPEKPPVTVKPVQTKPVDPNSLLKSIFFDFDQFDIRNDQVEAVKANLAVVKNAKKGYIILGGHADERGSNNYNIKLSAQRTETVKRYLILNGIKAERIITYAYGETSPKYLGHNEQSWQFNRRVDIAIWAKVPSRKDALKN
jgi:outer membrane protein OmpA-like peptidoglycan-associated protein